MNCGEVTRHPIARWNQALVWRTYWLFWIAGDVQATCQVHHLDQAARRSPRPSMGKRAREDTMLCRETVRSVGAPCC